MFILFILWSQELYHLIIYHLICFPTEYAVNSVIYCGSISKTQQVRHFTHLQMIIQRTKDLRDMVRSAVTNGIQELSINHVFRLKNAQQWIYTSYILKWTECCCHLPWLEVCTQNILPSNILHSFLKCSDNFCGHLASQVRWPGAIEVHGDASKVYEETSHYMRLCMYWYFHGPF